jgi:hypothetical protein
VHAADHRYPFAGKQIADRPALQDLTEVRRQLRLPDEALVEKDWFVVKALAAIAAADKGPFRLESPRAPNSRRLLRAMTEQKMQLLQ